MAINGTALVQVPSLLALNVSWDSITETSRGRITDDGGYRRLRSTSASPIMRRDLREMALMAQHPKAQIRSGQCVTKGYVEVSLWGRVWLVDYDLAA